MVGSVIFAGSIPEISTDQPGLTLIIIQAKPLSTRLGMTLNRSKGKVSRKSKLTRKKKKMMHTAQYIHKMILKRVFVIAVCSFLAEEPCESSHLLLQAFVLLLLCLNLLMP